MRLVTAATAALLAVAPAVAMVSPVQAGAVPGPEKYVVSARTTTVQVESSAGTVRIRGQVQPWAVGQKVVLLQRLAGSRRWTRSGTARLDRTSRFVLTDRPTRAGVRFYRVLKPASRTVRADRSPTFRVEALRWERLTDLTPSGGCGLQEGVTVAINGTSYPSSLLYPGPPSFACIPSVVYDLAGRCTALRGSYGFVDGQWQAGAVGVVGVSADERSLRTYSLVEGSVHEHVVLDITGAQRLRLDLVSGDAPPQPGGQVAAGTPEVLCLP